MKSREHRSPYNNAIYLQFCDLGIEIGIFDNILRRHGPRRGFNRGTIDLEGGMNVREVGGFDAHASFHTVRFNCRAYQGRCSSIVAVRSAKRR